MEIWLIDWASMEPARKWMHAAWSTMFLTNENLIHTCLVTKFTKELHMKCFCCHLTFLLLSQTYYFDSQSYQ